MDIGILALQGDFKEHAEAVSEVGGRPRFVKRPHDLSEIDGLVLPGGESTTLSMLLESAELTEPIGKLLFSGLPTFATCAGMILLADTVLDGRGDQETFGVIDIDVRRNGFGRQLQSFEAELDVAGFNSPMPVVFIRAPRVERVGESVEVLARVDMTGEPVAALVRQGSILASAFHPELTRDRRLHRMFFEMIEKKGR